MCGGHWDDQFVVVAVVVVPEGYRVIINNKKARVALRFPWPAVVKFSRIEEGRVVGREMKEEQVGN